MAPYQGKNPRTGGSGGNRTGGSYPPRENVSLRLQHLPMAKDKGDYCLVEVIVELLVSGRLAQGKIVHLSVDTVNWITKTTDTNGSASHVFMISKTEAGKRIEVAAKTEDGKTEVKSSVDVPKRMRAHALSVEACGKNGKYFLLLQVTDEAKEGVEAEIIIASADGQPILSEDAIITTNRDGYAKVNIIPFHEPEKSVLIRVIGSDIVKTITLAGPKTEQTLGPVPGLGFFGNIAKGCEDTGRIFPW